MDRMYNLNETAYLLGIRVRTARQWVHAGKIKAQKYEKSRRWYVTEAEIKRIRREHDN